MDTFEQPHYKTIHHHHTNHTIPNIPMLSLLHTLPRAHGLNRSNKSTYTLHGNTPDTHANTLTIASLLTKFKHTECYIALPSSLQTHVNRKNLALWLKHTHNCVDDAGKHVLGAVHTSC